MVKLSNESGKQAAFLLKQAAAGIRMLVVENTELKRKVASLETKARIDEVKRAMDESGAVNHWGGEAERQAALEKAAAVGKLDVIEEAIRMAPDLSQVKVGELLDGSGPNNPKPSSVSKAALDAHVMG